MVIRGLIVDCLTAGSGIREFTRDFIGSGPRYVAGFIELVSQNDIQCDILRSDNILEENSEILAEYNLIGFSLMTMDLPIAKKILRKWKIFHPNPDYRLSFIGGPATLDETLLKQLNVDFSTVRQAEIALYFIFQKHFDLIEKYLQKPLNKVKSNVEVNLEVKEWKNTLLSKIPGIIYSISGQNKIIDNQNNRALINLQSEYSSNLKNWFTQGSGFPEKIINYKDYPYSRIYVECLRGCSNFRRTSLPLFAGKSCEDNPCEICRDFPFKTRLLCPENIPPGCGFCSTISQFGSVVSRDISAILQEIEYLIRIGAKRIVLGGPDILDFYRERTIEGELIDPINPEPNYRALETLISGLLKNPKIRNHKVQLFFENVKASLCTDRALSILSQIPSPIFSIGCETGSAEFADILGRPSHPERIYSAVKSALEKGIRVHVYFIHSLPGDTPKFAQETLELIKKFVILNVDKITLYKYQELPGSPFWKISKRMEPPSKDLLKIYKQIKRVVLHFNQAKKKEIIGKEFQVFISEINRNYPQDGIGWILEGGPKVSVIKGAEYVGTFQKIRILKVLSDRLVQGEIVKKANF